jgi:transposase-like protein
MTNFEELEKVRRKCEVISEIVNNELDDYHKHHRAYFEYSCDGEVCTHCGSSLKGKMGVINGRQRWRCFSCQRTFYVEQEKGVLNE